jgi:hypothetical protein
LLSYSDIRLTKLPGRERQLTGQFVSVSGSASIMIRIYHSNFALLRTA